jgi:hypothetical protein
VDCDIHEITDPLLHTSARSLACSAKLTWGPKRPQRQILNNNNVIALLHTSPAMAPKKAAAQAEVALLQSLKSCLVNLPSSLVGVLTNANTVGASLNIACTELTTPSDCPKCGRGAELPTSPSSDGGQCRQSARQHSQINLCGMDGYAEQAQTCGRRGKRWDSWEPREHGVERAGGSSRRTGRDICAPAGYCGWAEGRHADLV